jgi:hypothetical protein
MVANNEWWIAWRAVTLLERMIKNREDEKGRG